MEHNRRRSKNSRGTTRSAHTIAECLVAFAMLLPIAVLVGKIGLQTEQASRESALASHAFRDLINAREEIGSWAFNDISQSTIESIPFQKSTEFHEDSRRWVTSIEEETEPIQAMRISLSLQWTSGRSEIPAEVGPITFWVPRP